MIGVRRLSGLSAQPDQRFLCTDFFVTFVSTVHFTPEDGSGEGLWILFAGTALTQDCLFTPKNDLERYFSEYYFLFVCRF